MMLAFFTLYAAVQPVQGLARVPLHLVPDAPAELRFTAPRMAVSVPRIAAACSVPTLMGYWKSEYGVSYAYGSAMLTTGVIVFASSPVTPLARAHAACIAMYGLRLNLFLLWRELSIPRFRDFREKIEARAIQRGSRLARTPFILSCSVLYLGMASPMLLTASSAALGPAAPLLVAVMLSGLCVAAVGDLWKSVVKARAGSDTLVTTGPFALLRHPNYTGEFALWTANAALGLSAASASGAGWLASTAGWLGLSGLGVLGICFVLMQAATSLEAKQAEKHAGSPTYEAWVRVTWAGPTLAKKQD